MISLPNEIPSYNTYFLVWMSDCFFACLPILPFNLVVFHLLIGSTFQCVTAQSAAVHSTLAATRTRWDFLLETVTDLVEYNCQQLYLYKCYLATFI